MCSAGDVEDPLPELRYVDYSDIVHGGKQVRGTVFMKTWCNDRVWCGIDPAKTQSWRRSPRVDNTTLVTCFGCLVGDK